jgi:cellulase
MSNDVRCNASPAAAQGKCGVSAGDIVTVEMHQQPNDRSCSNEAIGGNHYGPVMVYLSKVDNAATADGSAGWYKIYEDSWAKNPSGQSGSDDFWGVKDMNKCCGRVDVPIPRDTPAGDYLLRAEVIALHTAGSPNGAQLYMTCYQLTIDGSGNASPATVRFPGAYSAQDPGILFNMYQPVSSYKAPGPAVVSGGTTKKAGSGCTGCEASCRP